MAWWKHLGWWVPVGVAFSDLIGCIVRVDGDSMQPTLNPGGSGSTSDAAALRPQPDRDWVLVEKVSYKWLHRYQRGDVAVLWAPDNPRQQIVKRVIAVQGDVLAQAAGVEAPMPIGQGRCWIEGDNAVGCDDSRTVFGPVHLGLLEGRVTHVIWPPWRFGPVPRVAPAGRVLAVDDSSPQG